MPRKPSGEFDQKAYIAEYHRTHLRALTIKVQRDEYDRFQAACEAKGEPMATALRRFMAQYAEETGRKEGD